MMARSRTRKPPTLAQRITDAYESSDRLLEAGHYRCLVCGAVAVDASHQVPEVGGYIGGRVSEDQLAAAARIKLNLETRSEVCVSWPLAGFSWCGYAKLVGAAGDDRTEKRLQTIGFRTGRKAGAGEARK